MQQHRPGRARAAASPTPWPRRPGASADEIGFPVIIRPSLHAGRHGRRHRLQPRGVRGHARSWGLELAPDRRGAHRGVGHRLEGVRAGGDARRQGQRRHHLLHRELRPDGRAHRRLHHRGPGADPDRQGIPDACATPRSPSSARSAWRPAAPTSSSPSTRATGRMVVIEMNPRVSRSPRRWPPRPPASPSPRSPPSSPWATRSTRSPTTSPARPRPPSSRPSTTWSPRSRASPSRSSPAPTPR